MAPISKLLSQQYAVRFAYEPLESPSSEIRLLELYPGTFNEVVQCRLSTSSLTCLPSYEPLSYFWGSQTHLEEVFIDGGSFLVTQNLAAALRRLRHPEICRILWVDAICINQKDASEKGSQIPLMADIYKRGMQTIVWLGDQDRNTADAFAMLETMARYCDSVSEEQVVKLNPDKWWVLKKAMKKKHPTEITVSDFEKPIASPRYWFRLPFVKLAERARRSVFERPWFKRVWVVQEIALSERAMVLCGQYSVSWDTLEKAYKVSQYWDQWEHGQQLQSLIQMRKRVQSGSQEDLGQVIQKVFHCEATVSMDRIYSILGIANPLPEGLSIAVDYSADPDVKFAEATRVCLTTSDDPQLLFAGDRNPALQDSMLPSWAWSQYPDPQQPVRRWRFDDETARYALHAPSTPRKGRRLSFSSDGHLLHLQGVVFDEVVEVGPVFGSLKTGLGISIHASGFQIGTQSRPRDLGIHWNESKNVADAVHSRTYPGTDETRREAWLNFLSEIALMSGSTEGESKVKEEVYLVDIFIRPWYLRLRPRKWSNTKWTTPEDRKRNRMVYRKLLYSNNIQVLLVNYLAKRRVVRTSRGYIGLCDRHTRTGDHVALVDGICTPVILRPSQDGKRKLIGNSFIYSVIFNDLWVDNRIQKLYIE